MDRNFLSGYRSCYLFGLVLLLFAVGLGSQERIPLQGDGIQDSKPEDFSIKVGVEEVRLDAVVVDEKGHQIPNLTSDDFEIYQDGKRQKITAAKYIRSPKPTAATPGYLPALARSEVHRTIVFVFDNLSMTPGHVHDARMAIRKFVETQMLPGDLVSIVPTAGGNAALQTFSSDKRQLLSIVENVRWYLNPINIRTTPQIFALSYCIRALQEMPGRKYVLLISAQTDSPSIYVWGTAKPAEVVARARMAGAPDGLAGDQIRKSYETFLSDSNPAFGKWVAAMDRLAAGASRAGVVVHTLNIWGVDYVNVYDQHSQMTPLPRKTGGLFLANNFFLNGIGDLNEEMSGYYLLSYIPPSGTFGRNPDVFHRIKIRVKRPGCKIHTREGFYGTTKDQEDLTKSGDPLIRAMLSPFRHADFALSLAAGYVEDAPKGYLLQAFLHVDGRALQVLDSKDKGHSISFEAVATTIDINGDFHDSGRIQRDISFNDDEASWIREHGIRFSLSIPSKNPGAYYVRVAIQDKASGKIGSAYQFVEIPDLKKGLLALSSISVANSGERASGNEARDLIPVSYLAGGRSPAQMPYRPGESFEYVSLIYNAKGTKPELESRYTLFKDGEEFYKSEFEPVDLSGVSDLHKIPIRKRLDLKSTMQPGNYVLQLLVRDKQAGKKEPPASQSLNFEVLAQ